MSLTKSPTPIAFSELKLPVQVLEALSAMKFKAPTPIQSQAIPVVLSHRDLIASANRGSGKTAAFGIPLIAGLMKNPRKHALILVPDREVADQINEVLGQLSKKTPQISRVVLTTSTSMAAQLKELQKRPRIVTATPARLVDHMKRGALSLSATEVLVIAEADRMLESGLAPHLSEILRFLPKHRQTLLFSQTMPEEILKLAKKWQKDPVRVSAETTH